MKEKNYKELTINDLAFKFDDLSTKMADGFAETTKNHNNLVKSIEDLTVATAGGFQHVMDEIQSVRTELKGEIQSVRTELKGEIQSVREEVKALRDEVRSEFSKLWFEVDQIKHRLDKINKNHCEEIVLISGDIIVLKDKLFKLEQKVAKLKLAN